MFPHYSTTLNRGTIQNIDYYNIAGDVTGSVGTKSKFEAKTVEVKKNIIGSKQEQEESENEHSFDDLSSIEEWFFKQKKVDNQIHLLLVAIFAGNSLRFVNAAREYIKQLLQPKKVVSKSDDTPSIIPPFQRSTSDILRETQTTISKTKYGVESGLADEEVVDFIKSDAQKFALDFLRSSPDIEQFRFNLAGWLIQVCKADTINLHLLGTPLADLTRAQAAIGLGELAKNNYGYYLSSIIRPWARSQDPFLRFIVGWVLFALATDDKYRSSIFSLLTHWAKSNNVYMQWTAAVACSRVGLIDIDQTLEIIKVLLESKSPAILYALRISIGLLYLSAKNAYKILEVFVEWTQIDNKENRRLVEAIPPFFLSLAGSKFGDDIDKDKEPDSSDKNTGISVWHLIDREIRQGNSDLLTCVAALIRQGFIHPSAKIADWTSEVVEEWILEADKVENKSIFEATYQVLDVLLKDEKSSRSVKRILSRKKFLNNKMAIRLRNIYGQGG